MSESLVVIVRGVIGFFSLLIFARLLGKQQVSQLNLFEYILGITIGSIAATLTTDLSSSAWSHWIGLFIWCLLVLLMQLLSIKVPKLAEYLNGKPVLLIVNGKIMDKEMKTQRYSLADLLEQLRGKDIFNIHDVEFAVLETNGELTVLKKSQNQYATPHDMGISTGYIGLPTELIMYGKIMEDNLKKINLDTNWLMNELSKNNIINPEDVYLASINTKGELYIDLYQDNYSENI